MRTNRSDSSTPRQNQGTRGSGKLSVLANQKVGQRLRQNIAASGDASGPAPRRVAGKRLGSPSSPSSPSSPWLQRLLLRVLHNGFWLLAACGLMLKWVVELFAGDDAMRQSREDTTVEPFLEEWQEEVQGVSPMERDLVDAWSQEGPEMVPSGLRDFESLKMASLAAEEHDLSDEALADQAASLRARLERVRHEN